MPKKVHSDGLCPTPHVKPAVMIDKHDNHITLAGRSGARTARPRSYCVASRRRCGPLRELSRLVTRKPGLTGINRAMKKYIFCRRELHLFDRMDRMSAASEGLFLHSVHSAQIRHRAGPEAGIRKTGVPA